MSPERRFRNVMSRFVTGVTVMAVADAGGPHGMTANAVTSVSLDPLLVLVCVGDVTGMSERVRETGAFALSILPAEAEDIANHFANDERAAGHAQFEGVDVSTATTGSPVLDGSLAWVDCRVWAIHDGGDHDIVVGEVVDCNAAANAPALAWYRSDYTRVDLP